MEMEAKMRVLFSESKNKSEYSFIRKIKKYRASFIMLAPFTILFVVFTIIPVSSAIVLSLTNFDMIQKPLFTGFENYIRMFIDDDIFLIAIKNTVIFAAVTGSIGYLFSFVFAWFINEFGRKMRSILTLIFYAPSLAGNVYFIWLYIFSGDRYGFFNSYLLKFGFISEPLQWLTDPKYNMGVVILVVIWLSMGAGFLSFIAGFQNINKTYYEAAAIDGIKNRWQELFYVTLPQMVPQLMFGAVMSIAASFSVGYQSMTLTGFPSTNYSTHTLLLHMLDYGTIRYEMGYASTIAVFLFAMMLISWIIINKVLAKISGD